MIRMYYIVLFRFLHFNSGCMRWCKSKLKFTKISLQSIALTLMCFCLLNIAVLPPIQFKHSCFSQKFIFSFYSFVFVAALACFPNSFFNSFIRNLFSIREEHKENIARYVAEKQTEGEMLECQACRIKAATPEQLWDECIRLQKGKIFGRTRTYSCDKCDVHLSEIEWLQKHFQGNS